MQNFSRNSGLWKSVANVAVSIPLEDQMQSRFAALLRELLTARLTFHEIPEARRKRNRMQVTNWKPHMLDTVGHCRNQHSINYLHSQYVP